MFKIEVFLDHGTPALLNSLHDSTTSEGVSLQDGSLQHLALGMGDAWGMHEVIFLKEEKFLILKKDLILFAYLPIFSHY